MINIRAAQIADVDYIIDFQIKMAKETEDLILSSNHLSPGIKAVLEDSGKGTYYVACDEGRVVGCLLITYEWSEWRNGTVLWIQSVYVEKEYRGKGVFRKLYEHIKTQVEEKSELKGIRLYVEKDNVAAQKVYTALGMDGEHYKMFEWMNS